MFILRVFCLFEFLLFVGYCVVSCWFCWVWFVRLLVGFVGLWFVFGFDG